MESELTTENRKVVKLREKNNSLKQKTPAPVSNKVNSNTELKPVHKNLYSKLGGDKFMSMSCVKINEVLHNKLLDLPISSSRTVYT